MRLPAGWGALPLTLRFTGGAGAVDMVYLGTKAALLTLGVPDCAARPGGLLSGGGNGVGLLAASLLFPGGAGGFAAALAGALAVTAGIWAALETRSFQLFSGNVTLCYALVFTSFALVPVCVLRLFCSPTRTLNKFATSTDHWLSAVNFVWIQAARFWGGRPYLRTITGVHLLVLAAAGGICVWLKKGRGLNAALQPHPACLPAHFWGLWHGGYARFLPGRPRRTTCCSPAGDFCALQGR